MTTETWLIVAVLWIVCAVGAYLIAGQKGDPSPGMWGMAGLLLGPIGVGMAMVMAAPRVATPVPARDDRTARLVIVALVVGTLIAAVVMMAALVAMRPG